METVMVQEKTATSALMQICLEVLNLQLHVTLNYAAIQHAVASKVKNAFVRLMKHAKKQHENKHKNITNNINSSSGGIIYLFKHKHKQNRQLLN